MLRLRAIEVHYYYYYYYYYSFSVLFIEFDQRMTSETLEIIEKISKTEAKFGQLEIERLQVWS